MALRECRVPGCTAKLHSRNLSGVCRLHNHSEFCECRTCVAQNRPEDSRPPLAMGPLDHNRCRMLWCAVLREGIRGDLAARQRRYAGSSGFQEVCFLAGLDPDCVSDFVDLALTLPDPVSALRRGEGQSV